MTFLIRQFAIALRLLGRAADLLITAEHSRPATVPPAEEPPS